MTAAEEARLERRLAASDSRCEVCGRRMARGVFDRSFVCGRCRRALERILLREKGLSDILERL